jgi:hypothetical protein
VWIFAKVFLNNSIFFLTSFGIFTFTEDGCSNQVAAECVSVIGNKGGSFLKSISIANSLRGAKGSPGGK